jgi:hypothetical protein
VRRAAVAVAVAGDSSSLGSGGGGPRRGGSRRGASLSSARDKRDSVGKRPLLACGAAACVA